MQLKPMTQKEFDQWKNRSIKLYAQDKQQSHNLSAESAFELAQKSFKDLLPQDLLTPEAYLYSAFDDEKMLVGQIWFNLKKSDKGNRAFIFDVIIEQEFRAKGCGTQLMLLVEEEMKKLQVTRVGLHVFSYNTVALNLYKKLGYHVTDINMEKDLSQKTVDIAIPSFYTERLILRAPSMEDAKSYQEHFDDYEVIRNLSNAIPWPYPTNGAYEYLKNVVIPMQGKDRWTWGIYLKSKPLELIGCVDIFKRSDRGNRGFWLGRKFWNQGIMSEAVKPIVDYAFLQLGFEKLIFENALGNMGSRKIKEKTGARFIGIKNSLHVDPKLNQSEQWELRRENWLKQSRPSFIGNFKDLQDEDNASYPGSNELLAIGSPVGKKLGLKKIGIHIETVPPGRRTSWPHAESEEEEFAYVIKGNPQVWLNGFVYDLNDGDFVALPAGTGIAHTFINNTKSDVVLLVGGDSKIASNKIFYPMHPERNKEMRSIGKLWENISKSTLGPHNGIPSNN